MNREGQVWEMNFGGTPEKGLVLKTRHVGQLYDYYPDGKYDVWVHDVILVDSLIASVFLGKECRVFQKWKEFSNQSWERWESYGTGAKQIK